MAWCVADNDGMLLDIEKLTRNGYMMHRLVTVIFMLLITLCASAQSLKADFVQTRYVRMLNEKTVAKGRLEVSGQMVRWEYTSPFACVVLINKDRVTINRDGKQQTIDTGNNGMMRALSRLFSKSIAVQGKKGATNELAVPKDMKQMYSRITVHYSSKTGVADRVTLYETEGDRTEIELKPHPQPLSKGERR